MRESESDDPLASPMIYPSTMQNKLGKWLCYCRSDLQQHSHKVLPIQAQSQVTKSVRATALELICGYRL